MGTENNKNMSIKTYKLVLSCFVFFILFGISVKVFATPPTTQYSAAETLNPTCAPGSTNCSVSVGSGSGWGLTGNAGTTPGTNFIGTTDAQDLVFKTSNVQTGKISSTGLSVSLGITAGNSGASTVHTNFIGVHAGGGATFAEYSNFIGSSAGVLAINASHSNFIGEFAGYGATNANLSNFIGDSAGLNATNAANSIFIGNGAGNSDTVDNTVSGYSILIGQGTYTGGFSNSISLGSGAHNTDSNQLVIGGDSSIGSITSAYIGKGATSASPVGFSLNATGGSGTDISGGSITIAGGKATGDASGGSIIFQTSDAGATGTTAQSLTTKMSLLANGDLGIGTNPSFVKLGVRSSAGGQLQLEYDSSNFALFTVNSSGTLQISGHAGFNPSQGSVDINGMNITPNGSLNVGNGRFQVNSNSGKVGVGITPGYKFDVLDDSASTYVANFFNDGNNDNRYGISIQAGADTPSANKWIQFNDGDGTDQGSICYTGGQANICAPSDVRLKNNIVDTNINLDTLLQIKVRDFAYNSDSNNRVVHGFIAQELYDVYPDAVSKAENPNEYWKVSYNQLTPLIVKSIQSLNLKIEPLTRLNTDTSGTLGYLIKNFLANSANTLENIFTNKITTKQICVDESTCLNESDIRALIESAHNNQNTTQINVPVTTGNTATDTQIPAPDNTQNTTENTTNTTTEVPVNTDTVN